MNINKLLKWKERYMALLLACTIPLNAVGCASKSNNNDNKKEVISIEEALKNANKYEKKTEEMTDGRLNQYVSYFATLNSLYNFEEYYITNEKIDKILADNKSELTCDYDFNNDIESIVDKIVTNSKEFLKNNKEYTNAFDVLTTDCYSIETILKNILEEMVKNATNDIDEDMCLIKELKVVIGTNDNSSILAMYDEESNLITIYNDNIINSIKDNDKSKYLTELSKTLAHELNHVRQIACRHRTEKGKTLTSTDYIDDYVSTFTESSAESYISNIIDDYTFDSLNYIYFKERESESLFLMLGLFTGSTIDDYYNAILNSDIEALMNFTGAKNKNEVYNIFKIMYAIDSTNGRTPLYTNFFHESDDVSLGELKSLVGFQYRVDIFKWVLKNLVEYTAINDIDIDKNIVLFKTVKNLIVNNACTYETTFDNTGKEQVNPIYDEDFVNNITMLNDKYLKFLSEYYNISLEDVKTLEAGNSKIVRGIISTCNGIGSIDYKYENIVSEFMTEFPLLKPIIYPEIINSFEYENFISDNNLTRG